MTGQSAWSLTGQGTPVLFFHPPCSLGAWPLGLEHEVLLGLFLDAHQRLLVAQKLFRGTLTQTSVYPRELVKEALRHNAAAMIVAHNHPGSVAEPSRADEHLTQSLKTALAMVDVRLLDHFVIGCDAIVSFAERGMV